MGKTKTKIMDDSVPAEEPKKTSRKLGRHDDLVEQLKAELADVGTPSKETKPEPKKAEEVLETEDKKETKVEEKEEPKSEKKAQKPGKEKPRSKKYQEASKDLDKTKTYALAEAIELTKKSSYTKFTGTLEAHINTATTNIRGLVSLPFVSGK